MIQTSPHSPNSPNESELSSQPCCSCWNFSTNHRNKTDKWQRISSSEDQQIQPVVDRSLWEKCVNAFKKAKEWSELVAGPKWKTFIRRFNRAASRGKSGKFQYDPLSYSLNFDEGQDGHFEDDRLFRNFSSRYTVIASQAHHEISDDCETDTRSND